MLVTERWDTQIADSQTYRPASFKDHLFIQIMWSCGPLLFCMFHCNMKVFHLKEKFLSHDFCTSLLFEAELLARRYQAKFLLYLDCLKPPTHLEENKPYSNVWGANREHAGLCSSLTMSTSYDFFFFLATYRRPMLGCEVMFLMCKYISYMYQGRGTLVFSFGHWHQQGPIP